jgi:lysophospholipase L1-like esterase
VRHPTVRKLLVALAAALLPFGLLEAGARIWLPPAPANDFPGLSPDEMEDAELLWRLRPGAPESEQGGPVDSHGFRGPELPLEKQPGEIRILSLGESSTYGAKVAWSDTYSHRLEEILRARGQPVRVINAGVRAWSTVQSARFLDLHADELEPDVVLVYQEVNDFLPTTFRGLALPGAGLTDREMMDWTARRAPVRALVRSSRLLTALSLALARARADASLRAVAEESDRDLLFARALPYEAVRGAPPGERPWMANPNALVRVPDPDREAALAELLAATRRAGARLVLLHPAYPVSVPHRCLQTRFAREHGVPLLEIEDVLARAAAADGVSRGDFFVPDDDYHPNERGHAVIARAVADFLQANGLLAATD